MTKAEWVVVVIEGRRKGNPVAGILDRADMPARYACEGTEMAFKEDVAKNGLSSHASYDQVCRRHPCIGEVIPADRLPAHLCRVMSADSAWRRATAYGDGASWSVHADDRRAPAEGTWRRGDKATHGSDFLPSLRGSNVAFANLDPDDPDPGGGPPTPRILERARAHTGPHGNLADALVWITARTVPPKGTAMVLVSYGLRHFASCHYPVPPDAPGHERFRPVPPGCDEPYGRSWPVGVDAKDHLKPGNGVPEVTHRNRLVPIADVWCYGLPETSLG